MHLHPNPKIENFTAKTGQKAKGRMKLLVIAPDGRIHEERPWQNNLILNQGLNEVAERTWEDCFSHCAVGTGNTPVAVDSGATQASQSGTTVTASAGIFSAGDVGKLIRWDSGAEATITAYTSPTVVTVTPSQTVALGDFTIYQTTQTALVTEVRRNTSYLTGAGNCGTSTVGNQRTMKRTYDFDPEVSAQNYAEVGFSWSASAGANLFSRVLITGGSVNVPIGFQIRIVYELRITVDPDTLTAKTASITGWPVAPATQTEGDEQLVPIALAIVNTDGNTEADPNITLEPSVPGAVFISSHSAPPATFGTTDTRGGTIATKAVNQAVTPYVNGNYYIDKQVTFAVGEANATNWRSIGTCFPGDEYAAGFEATYIFVFDQNQTKANTHTLRLTFRTTWGRDLS